MNYLSGCPPHPLALGQNLGFLKGCSDGLTLDYHHVKCGNIHIPLAGGDTRPREAEWHGQGHTVSWWQNWWARSDLRYTPSHSDLTDLRHTLKGVLRRVAPTSSDYFSCQIVF